MAFSASGLTSLTPAHVSILELGSHRSFGGAALVQTGLVAGREIGRCRPFSAGEVRLGAARAAETPNPLFTT